MSDSRADLGGELQIYSTPLKFLVVERGIDKFLRLMAMMEKGYIEARVVAKWLGNER